jgi:hypothetical protein
MCESKNLETSLHATAISNKQCFPNWSADISDGHATNNSIQYSVIYMPSHSAVVGEKNLGGAHQKFS